MPVLRSSRTSATEDGNEERVSAGAFGVGECASAGSAGDGGATGSARGAPLLMGKAEQEEFDSIGICIRH